VKIYATDIDEDALAVARSATYTAHEVESVPPELRKRYFDRSDQRYTFRADLRRTLIFGRNNLVHDAPISRLDLLVCRNTLMYLTAETQGHILRRFHFALRDTGILMLGKSELMISHRELFAAVDVKRRIFRRLERAASLQARVAGLVNDGDRIEYPPTEEDRQLRDAALELSPQPQLVVSRSAILVLANVAARALFGIGTEDVGQPLAELRIAREPANLIGPIERAIAERRSVAIGRVEFRPTKGERRQLECTVLPLLAAANTALGAAVIFEDVSRFRALEEELEALRRDLESA
jgi:two-component system CheB/CheR fusion protein